MAGKNLTARFVETVSTKLEREDFRDATVRGLQLRVTKDGKKKTWTFRYRRKSDRAQRRVTLGIFVAKGEGMSLDDARVKARGLQAAVDSGADPAEEVQERKDAETFAEIAADWIERHGKPNKSARALQDDRSMMARHILPAIGALKATEITKRDIIRMLDAVAAKSDARIKPCRVKVTAKDEDAAAAEPRGLTHRPNRVFELVRAIFRWAVGRDLLKVDPSWGMSAPIKKEKPRERELSPDEIRKLWLALDRAPIQRRSTKGVPRGEKAVGSEDIPLTRATALALKLALATAQRIGEVAGIATAELDLNDTAPMWTIPGDRTKNGRPNRVPLSPIAVALIREAAALNPPACSWLFPSPKGDGAIDPHAPTKAIERARPAIGLADFRVHDLRRTAATRMAEMGISPHTISLVLNHVSARSGTITGRVYVQYSYDREKREALGAWGARLARIIAGADGGNVVVMETNSCVEVAGQRAGK